MDRLKSPLYGLLESALAFQCSGVGADGLLFFPAAVSLLIGAGSPAVFRVGWSRSLGRCFINPCPVFPAVLVRDRFKVSGSPGLRPQLFRHKVGCMVL